MRWLPGVRTLLQYERAWLRDDLVAGLVLTAVLVPVGIAYAVAAGVPAIAGLYATIFGLLAYALFGPSRVLVLGPDSALVALILGVVLPLSGGDPQRAIALAAMMALVSGTVCVLAGIARLGFVTELLSKPIRYGYMNGIALTVLVSQLPALFGFSAGGDDLIGESRAFVEGLVGGRVNAVALSLGIGTLAAILLLKRFRRLPAVLLAVAGAAATVAVARSLHARRRSGARLAAAGPAGLLVADDPLERHRAGADGRRGRGADLVRRHERAVARLCRPDGQALGSESGDGRARRGQPGGGAVPGHSDQRQRLAHAGGRGRWREDATGRRWSAPLAVAALLLWGAEPARHPAQGGAGGGRDRLGPGAVRDPRPAPDLSHPALGVLAVDRLLSSAWRCSGPIQGIALAIVIAVIEFLWDAWRPHSAVLGRVDGVKGYHDISRYPAARVVPGLVLFRWDAPLFFANAEFFRDRVLDAVAASPTPVRWLVVGAEPVTSVDVTAADILEELDRTLHAAGIELCFAEMKDPVKDKLKRFGLFRRLGEERFFATIGEAVSRYVEAEGVAWVDWEDRRIEGWMRSMRPGSMRGAAA